MGQNGAKAKVSFCLGVSMSPLSKHSPEGRRFCCGREYTAQGLDDVGVPYLYREKRIVCRERLRRLSLTRKAMRIWC